jgi:hypothetical protein
LTRWQRPARLRPEARAETVRLLKRLAEELDRQDADAIIANVAMGADDGHRHDLSGEYSGGKGSRGNSPVEAKAFATTKATQRSRDLLTDLHDLAPLLRGMLAAWSEWDPNRAIEPCPNCGNPLDRAYARCQWRDADGVQCGSRSGAERRCSTCDEPQPPGRALRKGECDACRKHRRRTGRARVATSMLALSDGLVVAGEPYTESEAA